MPRKGKPRRTPRLPDRPEEFGKTQAALLPVGERTECRVGLEGVLVPIGAMALLQLPIASLRTSAVPCSVVLHQQTGYYRFFALLFSNC
jgi:hypothetical protein